MRIATLEATPEEPVRRLAFVGPDGRVTPLPDAVRHLEESGIRRFSEDERRLLSGAPEDNGWLTPAGLALLRGIEEACGPGDGLAPVRRPVDGLQLAPPVPRPGKIIAVGRNYMDHVREGQEIWAKRGKEVKIPGFPTAFAKYPSSLTGPDRPILLPAGIDDVDYEIELAVVIGTPALDVPVERALDHVAGYTICNDVGARGIQRQEMEQQIGIVLAKNFPSFAPMGPWLVTADDIPDPQALDIQLTVDGEVRQHASTADMIFSVATLVSYWSRMGLEPGDIIITGTPSGVALARPDPAPFYLRDGQTVVASIAGIGALSNPVTRAS